MLRIHLFWIFPLSRLMTFNLEDTDKCTLNYYKNNIANTKITR